MTHHPASAPVDARDPGAIDRLRGDLARADFCSETAASLLGPVAESALGREQSIPALLATEGDDAPVAVLTRLFMLGAEVSTRALDGALESLGTSGALQLGLVEAGANGLVRARVDLQPYEAVDSLGTARWWIASDLGETTTGCTLRPDHVLGVGGASTTLAQITVRTPCDSVYDLGTGCGVQALHAARQAKRVVATDVSNRALSYAAFNAELNGLGSNGTALELRHGSLFEPAAGERFDLIVSNPPFVITPRSLTEPGYTYRDGGMSGDDLVREVFTKAPQYLSEGGVAQFLGNWEHREDLSWRERIEAWIDAAATGLGGERLDCWVIEREVQDPAEYAETWLRDGGLTSDRDRDGYRRGYEAYIEDFAARGVAGVGFGYVIMRRRSTPGPALRRLEEIHGPVAQPLGEEFGAVLAAYDLLDVTDLGAAHLRAAADVSEERFYTPGNADPNVVLIRRGGGFHRTIRAGTALAALVGACDGELSVNQIVGAIAVLLDLPSDRLRTELLEDIHGLVMDGFLVVER